MPTTCRARRVGAILLGAAVALAGLAAPASAANQRAAVFTLTFQGYAAMASWTTCPDLQSAALGDTCAGGDVMAFSAATSEQAGSETHLRDKRSGTLKVYEYRCQVTEFEIDPGVSERTCALTWERFGRATDAEVTTDPHLDAVRATASVPVQEWSGDSEAPTYATLDVAASFTGTGDTQRIDEREHQTDRYVMYLAGTRGWERACTATAAFDGTAVPGSLAWCSLSNVRQAEVRVYHHLPQ